MSQYPPVLGAPAPRRPTPGRSTLWPSAEFADALRLISDSLARPTGLAALLTLIAELAMRCLVCDQAAIYLAEPEAEVLALCAVAGAGQLSATVYHLRPGQGTPGQAVLTGNSLHVHDFFDFNEVGPMRPALGLLGTRSELSVPVWNNHRAAGALMVSAAAPAAFGAEVAEVLTLLAAQVSVAIRIAEITRQEAERALHSQLLTDVSLSVNSTLELDRVLQQAVSQVGAGLRADRCTLGHANQATSMLNTAIEYLNPLLSERRSLKNEGSIMRHAPELVRLLKAGQVVVSNENDIHPALEAIWPELASRYGVRSLAWVPILTSAGAAPDFYSLRLMQVTDPRCWTEAELELLRGLAAQLAMALNNAHLFRAQLQTARELQDKNAELQSLVYSVSHDLQAPIVSVHGFANLLKIRHSAQLDERGQFYIGRIAANAEYLTQLLADLLELSRVGRFEEPVEPVAVGPLVDDILADWSSRAGPTRVQVITPAEWPVVSYSRTRLHQVFCNLVSNAFKFLGPQPAPRIELGWQPVTAGDLNAIEFFVKDNGIGISPDYHQRIFGTFERLRQIDVAGTGIGLSIVRRIVEHRGGAIRVESALGQGSAFFFTVPVDAEPTQGELRRDGLQHADG